MGWRVEDGRVLSSSKSTTSILSVQLSLGYSWFQYQYHWWSLLILNFNCNIIEWQFFNSMPSSFIAVSLFSSADPLLSSSPVSFSSWELRSASLALRFAEQFLCICSKLLAYFAFFPKKKNSPLPEYQPPEAFEIVRKFYFAFQICFELLNLSFRPI